MTNSSDTYTPIAKPSARHSEIALPFGNFDTLARGPPGAVWDCASDFLAILDAKGQTVWLNEVGQQVWSESHQGTPFGKPFSQIWQASSREAVSRAIRTARTGKTSGHGIIMAAANSGSTWEAQISWTKGKTPAQSQFLVVARDVTKHLRLQASLRRAASFDAMTGLLNRASFIQQISHRALHQERLTLVLLDIDHLKRANDTDGHAAGNELIKHFATRLRRVQNHHTVAARVGGDEFAVAYFGKVDQLKLDKAIKALCEPAHIEQLTLPYSASAGIALELALGSSFEELYLSADVALYACKALGGGKHQFFHSEMRDELERRASLLKITKRSVATGNIVPHYQPKVDLATGVVVGFEALLRVRFPDATVQTATVVAAALAEPDLVAEIDRLMLDMVLADIRLSQEMSVSLPISINLADADVRDEGFAERFLVTIAAAAVDPRLIEVEITESVLLDNSSPAVEMTLRALSAAGVRVALDDFGTGYASLSHLKRFPIDVIKIDQQFIQNLSVDAVDQAIVRAIVGLGGSLAVNVVAEGIERPDQLEVLRSVGCRTGQGFLFSSAVPHHEACALAERGLRDRVALPLTRVP
jgi:diguanylate cyclase (GGDEF)-like protein